MIKDVITEMELQEMNKFKQNIKPWITILFILCIWYFICQLKIVSDYVLPSPQKVFFTFLNMMISGDLFEDVTISVIRVFKGFGIAFISAFILGMITVLKPQLNGYYDFLIQFFRNVPPLSLIPLLILWYGIGESTKIIIIVLASFFPIYLNIVKGFTECDPKLLEVGDVFGYSKWQKFYKISFPFALSDILIGARIGLGYSWRAIIGAEMIAASTGLGHMILFSQQMSRIDKVMVGIISIGILGYICDRIFANIIKKFLKGADICGWN